MNIYLILIVFIIATGLLCRNREKYVLISCFSMFVVYGLRNGRLFGLDASSYYSVFVSVGRLSSISELPFQNIGFGLFTYIINRWTGGNYQLFVTIIAAFVCFAFYRFIKKYSVNPLLSFMWYFGLLYFALNFTIFKQSIAMAILFFAFDALMERKAIKYIIIVLIASLFHAPAMVLLPAYWLSKIKPGKSYIVLVAVALLVTYLFRNQILHFMYNFYETGEILAESPEFLGGKVIYMLFILCVAMLLRTPTSEDRLYCVLLIFAGIAVVLQTFCYYNNMFERLADYYYQFSVLLIPLIIENREEPNSILTSNPAQIQEINVVGSIMITVFAFWRFYTYINVTAPQYFLPFKFFWE